MHLVLRHDSGFAQVAHHVGHFVGYSTEYRVHTSDGWNAGLRARGCATKSPVNDWEPIGVSVVVGHRTYVLYLALVITRLAGKLALIIREVLRAGGYRSLTVSENSLLVGMATTVAEVLSGEVPAIGWTPELS